MRHALETLYIATLLSGAMGSAAAAEIPADCFNDAHAESLQASTVPDVLRVTDADLAALLADLNRDGARRADFELPPVHTTRPDTAKQ